MTSGSPEPIEVGLLLAHSAGADKAELQEFTARLVEDAGPELRRASGRPWCFHRVDPTVFKSDEARRPADFIGEASLDLAEGSFDLMVVITDIALISSKERVVSGLASPLTRTCILSAGRLRSPRRGLPLPLDSPPVRWNGAALLLHLIGHVLGARAHERARGAMAPFRFSAERAEAPRFDERDRIARRSADFPEPEIPVRNAPHALLVHIAALLRNPRLAMRALLRNRAPLLPLKMPGLATAAVAPIFLLVFTAEFWDAGLGMSNGTAWVYAAISIIGAALYLSFGQNLFLPRKESRVIPEHLAVANAVIFLTMLLAVIGLFIMVGLLTLAIELWIFPADLIATWPTLQDPQVSVGDKVRLAAFISTIGVTTGSLAGGLERTEIMRHLALFRAEV